jgi:hypothetical protein
VTAAGAAIGALVGYLFFTDRGRAWRRRLEPAIDDLARELVSFRGTLARAVGAASEGWRLLNEAVGEDIQGAKTARYVNPHQTSPF